MGSGKQTWVGHVQGKQPPGCTMAPALQPYFLAKKKKSGTKSVMITQQRIDRSEPHKMTMDSPRPRRFSLGNFICLFFLTPNFPFLKHNFFINLVEEPLTLSSGQSLPSTHLTVHCD